MYIFFKFNIVLNFVYPRLGPVKGLLWQPSSGIETGIITYHYWIITEIIIINKLFAC